MAGRAAPVENGGRPITISTKEFSYQGIGAWQDVPDELDLRLSPDTGEAPWTRGHVIVSGGVSDTTTEPAHDYCYLEVRVIGVLGGVQTILAILALGNERPVGRVPVDDPYDKIVFQARQATNVDGVVPQSLTFRAGGRFYR